LTLVRGGVEHVAGEIRHRGIHIVAHGGSSPHPAWPLRGQADLPAWRGGKPAAALLPPPAVGQRATGGPRPPPAVPRWTGGGCWRASFWMPSGPGRPGRGTAWAS